MKLIEKNMTTSQPEMTGTLNYTIT